MTALLISCWACMLERLLTRCLCDQASHDATSLAVDVSLQSDTSTSDGISTFHVGQRREAPPPTLMSQVCCMHAPQIVPSAHLCHGIMLKLPFQKHCGPTREICSSSVLTPWFCAASCAKQQRRQCTRGAAQRL